MNETRMPRVLVVDDEERVRGVLCDLLIAWGCQVDGAASRAEGIEFFRHGDYDLVLTDFLMPGGNGLELIEGLRLADPTIGVIMLTASDTDLEAPSRRLEFTVLRKPLQLDALKTVVSQALRRHSRGALAALP